MKPRTIQLLLMVGAFLAGLAFFASVVMIIGNRNYASILTPQSGIGGPFRLIDHDGKAVTEQDFKGKPILVFFGFTHCPDICPTALFEMSEVLRKLGPDADRMRVLFISVDPERDTPTVLKDYLSSFEPQIRGLTGDAAAIAAVEKAYGVYSRKSPLDDGGYTMDHSAFVYLMDKDGRYVSRFDPKYRPLATFLTPDELRRYL
jgi:protein SCO1